MKKHCSAGMLTLISALALAAPAGAVDLANDPEFTGETVAVESTAASEQTCRDPEVAPLLADFKDRQLYFPAPGGDFESGADGWELEGGARIGLGSSAFAPLGLGRRSLQMPAGSSATSPAFCVDERYPTFRYTTGQLGAAKVKVKVSVVYPHLVRNVRHAADTDVDGKPGWKLSKAVPVQPLYGMKTRGWRLVALRFQVDKADVDADVRIDDVLVDPKMRS